MKYSTTTNRPEVFKNFEIAGNVTPDTVLVIFDESQSAEILSTVKKHVGVDVVYCQGEDHKIYLIDENGIQLATKYAKKPFSLEEWKEEINKTGKLTGKELAISEKYLSSVKEDTSVRRFGSFPFKAYEYVSKTYGISFPYRVRRSKAPGQPILINFHGGNLVGRENSNEMWGFYKSGKNKMLKPYDCTVIIPKCPVALVSDGKLLDKYLSAVKELSEKIAEETEADTDRIYLIGGSFGGGCVWKSVYLFPDYYAAAIPLMGAFKIEHEDDMTHFMNTSLWVAHSADDTTVVIKYDDDCVDRLRKMGKENLKYTRVNGYGHHYLTDYFLNNENWTEWMFAQRRK